MAQKGGYPGNPPPVYVPPGAAVYNVPNAGQVCIYTQPTIKQELVYTEFILV